MHNKYLLLSNEDSSVPVILLDIGALLSPNGRLLCRNGEWTVGNRFRPSASGKDESVADKRASKQIY